MKSFTLNDFTEEFDVPFFSRAKKQRLKDRFFELKQENMIIDEYSNEFHRLAHFALEMIPTEGSRAWKFEKGLRHDIRSYMSMKEWTNMKKTYEAALLHEQTIWKEKEGKQSGFKSRKPGRPRKRPQHMQGQTYAASVEVVGG